MIAEDDGVAVDAGPPSGCGEEKHAGADATVDPLHSGARGCSRVGENVSDLEEVPSSLSEAERSALFSSIEVSELQGATLLKAAMEQVEGIEEFADLESAVSALKERELELEAALEEQREAALVQSREMEQLKTELAHAQEERDVERKRLEARLERAERAHEENEKQQAYQLELAQSEVQRLNKQLDEAKNSVSQYSNVGMTPPGVRKMSRLSKASHGEDAPPRVAALAKEETVERRSSAPVPSRQGSSFDLLQDTTSKEESHTLKAMMRAQQSIVARKNIQISQLKSELTDAQRRLTVLESDPGASNANTLVYEQKYNDVKKQLFFSLVIGIKLTMAMQGHQINLNAQTLYERGQLLPEDCWNEWIYVYGRPCRL